MTPKKLFFRLIAVTALAIGWGTAWFYTWNETDLRKRTSTHEICAGDSILPAWAIAAGGTAIAVCAWKKGEYE